MAVAVKESSDQKKIFLAVGLGVLAIIALWWTFFGFGGSSKPQRPGNRAVAGASPTPVRTIESAPQAPIPQDAEFVKFIPSSTSQPAVPEPQRNIFAFYEKPVPSPTPPVIPSPTPTPTPPVTLSAVSPSNVYARTDDFTLEATGDKFTPAVHIVVDGRDLPTRYISAQQLSATVPASIIANPGQRTVMVRNADGSVYSLPTSFNVTAPPTPNYAYVGLLGKKRNIGDTAMLQDKTNKEILSV